MKKTKQVMAFEQLEAEMELITIEELMTHLGGAGSAQDIINYMNSTGATSWSSSSTGDVVGFSQSNYSSGGYYGPGGGFWASSGYSSGGYGSSGGGYDGGQGQISIQIDSGGAYLIDGQTYYTSSGMAYRKVSFDQGDTWVNEVMPITPIIPATSGTVSSHTGYGNSQDTLYISHSDAYNFLDGIQSGVTNAGWAATGLSFNAYTGLAGSLISGITGLTNLNWASVESKYMNSQGGGLVIQKNTTSMGGNFPGSVSIYTVQDIYGNRLGTVYSPGTL